MELTFRLLLDTHALLWTLLDPDRIPAAPLERIRDANTELYVSAASAWEIGTEFRLGRLSEAEAVVHGVRRPPHPPARALILDPPRAAAPWVAAQGISTHWLRYTTLTWVERHYGYGVARWSSRSCAPRTREGCG